MKRFAIRVTGKVQGVFFRQSTKEKADELGLCGFVRNEDDGSVYLEAEGEKAQLEKMIDWCRRGPSRARVDSVHTEEKNLEHDRDFNVRR